MNVGNDKGISRRALRKLEKNKFVNRSWAQKEYNSLSPMEQELVNKNVNYIFWKRNPDMMGKKLDPKKDKEAAERWKDTRAEVLGYTGRQFWREKASKLTKEWILQKPAAPDPDLIARMEYGGPLLKGDSTRPSAATPRSIQHLEGILPQRMSGKQFLKHVQDRLKEARIYGSDKFTVAYNIARSLTNDPLSETWLRNAASDPEGLKGLKKIKYTLVSRYDGAKYSEEGERMYNQLSKAISLGEKWGVEARAERKVRIKVADNFKAFKANFPVFSELVKKGLQKEIDRRYLGKNYSYMVEKIHLGEAADNRPMDLEEASPSPALADGHGLVIYASLSRSEEGIIRKPERVIDYNKGRFISLEPEKGGPLKVSVRPRDRVIGGKMHWIIGGIDLRDGKWIPASDVYKSLGRDAIEHDWVGQMIIDLVGISVAEFAGRALLKGLKGIGQLLTKEGSSVTPKLGKDVIEEGVEKSASKALSASAEKTAQDLGPTLSEYVRVSPDKVRLGVPRDTVPDAYGTTLEASARRTQTFRGIRGSETPPRSPSLSTTEPTLRRTETFRGMREPETPAKGPSLSTTEPPLSTTELPPPPSLSPYIPRVPRLPTEPPTGTTRIPYSTQNIRLLGEEVADKAARIGLAEDDAMKLLSYYGRGEISSGIDKLLSMGQPISAVIRQGKEVGRFLPYGYTPRDVLDIVVKLSSKGFNNEQIRAVFKTQGELLNYLNKMCGGTEKAISAEAIGSIKAVEGNVGAAIESKFFLRNLEEWGRLHPAKQVSELTAKEVSAYMKVTGLAPGRQLSKGGAMDKKTYEALWRKAEKSTRGLVKATLEKNLGKKEVGSAMLKILVAGGSFTAGGSLVFLGKKVEPEKTAESAIGKRVKPGERPEIGGPKAQLQRQMMREKALQKRRVTKEKEPLKDKAI